MTDSAKTNKAAEGWEERGGGGVEVSTVTQTARLQSEAHTYRHEKVFQTLCATCAMQFKICHKRHAVSISE